ncbi:MAG: hypothetical protein R3B70_01950 [Polyangiaceae bacterium]
MAKETNKHKWRFYRAGGFEQVRLESGFDLLALAELDQKLWTALACPVKGLEVDEKTLELIDTDKDGRIRAPELIAAITWIGPLLKDPNTLMKGSPKIVLSALADNDDGKRLAAAARQTLRNLGKKDAGELSADDMAEAHKSFDAKKFNGDGIVPPTSAEDDDVRAAIDDVLRIVSGVKDRADVEGVDRKKLDEFFDEAEAFSAWHKLAEDKAEEILPLGEKTASAAAALAAVAPKIDDYFTRVKLAAFDARATVPLSRDAAEYAALSPKLLSDKLDEVAGFPLAKIEPDQPLPLTSGLNPAWSAKMAAFAKEVVAPLLGDRPSLTEADFREVVSRFAAHEAWLADKKGARVEPLGKDRVRELLDRQMKGKIIDLLAQDEAEVPTRETLAELDKLVRLHRDLARFANNFVTFRDFYARKRPLSGRHSLPSTARAAISASTSRAPPPTPLSPRAPAPSSSIATSPKGSGEGQHRRRRHQRRPRRRRRGPVASSTTARARTDAAVTRA